MLRIMTREEVKEAEQRYDTWWASLEWGQKNHLYSFIHDWASSLEMHEREKSQRDIKSVCHACRLVSDVREDTCFDCGGELDRVGDVTEFLSSLEETDAILADKDLLENLATSVRQADAGETVPLESITIANGWDINDADSDPNQWKPATCSLCPGQFFNIEAALSEHLDWHERLEKIDNDPATG